MSERIVLFVPTAKVEDGYPSPWLQQRLDQAYQYYANHREQSELIVLSGRWSDSTTPFSETEAVVSERYLQALEPGLPTALEEFAVETGGNFAFSKPIIAAARPDKVVTFNSKVYEERVRYFARKLFDPNWGLEFSFVSDELARNPRAQQKEPKALAMFRSLSMT